MNRKAQGVVFAILALVALFALAGLVITLSRGTSVTGQGYDILLTMPNPPYDYPRTTYTATDWEHLEDPKTSVWRTQIPRPRPGALQDPYVTPKSAYWDTHPDWKYVSKGVYEPR